MVGFGFGVGLGAGGLRRTWLSWSEFRRMEEGRRKVDGVGE